MLSSSLFFEKDKNLEVSNITGAEKSTTFWRPGVIPKGAKPTSALYKERQKYLSGVILKNLKKI